MKRSKINEKEAEDSPLKEKERNKVEQLVEWCGEIIVFYPYTCIALWH